MFKRSIVLVCILIPALPTTIPAQSSLKEAFVLSHRRSVESRLLYRDRRGRDHARKTTVQRNHAGKRHEVGTDSSRPDAGLAGYSFENSDKYVEFGEKNGMYIIGHCLIWHSHAPRWVFEDSQGKPLDRAALLQRMREHIFTVVGRYKGRVMDGMS